MRRQEVSGIWGCLLGGKCFEGLGELIGRGPLPVQGEQEFPVHGSSFLGLELSHEADGDRTSKNEPNGDEAVYVLGVQPWYEPIVSLVVGGFIIHANEP